MASITTLSWQIAKHMLDGGRARVYLNAAIWEPGVKLLVNRTGKWETHTRDFEHASPENIEVAQLVVENPGRTPITVYNPALIISGSGRRNHAISPRMFKASLFGHETPATETLVRIDPYDRVTFLLDYWSVLPALLEGARKSKIRLRGGVCVAGRKRPRKSSRYLAWIIPRGSWTANKGVTEISPYTVMWRELYRATVSGREYDELNTYQLGVVLREAFQEFDSCPAREDFEAALERAEERHEIDCGALTVATLVMYESLKRDSNHLSKWPRSPKRESGQYQSVIKEGN
ncbi:hypothetical protein FCH28_11395 [Streptomyces piniterrae]|uniref:Uncharacterized protein n=1 Tax=Streptomyces piniterrae TaxID=2571125 RepID=A0A4U0NPP7_9ACTN|nr:hypothetical protein [Streptomyces piniterrae]TJZ55882.1 hypothetical protein FCH28_11395 [Streptomyces piniterrae]